MPDFPIVDSHVHLYDLDRLPYPWLQHVPKINRSFLLPDFDAARGAVEVERIVFAEVLVETGLHLEEARFAQEQADHDRRVAGIIAYAPVEKGAAVEDDLAALSQFAALRGIRRLIETERDPTMALEPGFTEGVRRVGRHGLPFDICVKHWGMVAAVALAQRCPDVQLVLDHIGKPGIRHGLKEPWWSQMRALAALPNVACKISGVITEADHAHWRPDQVKPYVAHAIECFGFDRVLFGSDWPVATLTHAYPTWVALVDEVVAGCSEAEARKLYRDNAERIYRLSN